MNSVGIFEWIYLYNQLPWEYTQLIYIWTIWKPKNNDETYIDYPGLLSETES